METLTTQEPAPSVERIDCGHFQPIGICPKCKRPHGYQVSIHPQSPIPNPPTP